jgi:hypothetical protein
MVGLRGRARRAQVLDPMRDVGVSVGAHPGRTAFSTVNRFRMALLRGRTRRVTATNGGFRPGQFIPNPMNPPAHPTWLNISGGGACATPTACPGPGSFAVSRHNLRFGDGTSSPWRRNHLHHPVY